MKLTKELAEELHTELWLWLAERPELEKQDWPRWGYNGGDIGVTTTGCFPCEYKMQNNPRDILCHCVLDFPGWRRATRSDATCLGGLFWKWIHASGSKRSALAICSGCG